MINRLKEVKMMLHTMKLTKNPFEKIKNKTKTIELRLYDEKRQKVKVGDFIEFSLIDNPKEKIQTKVIGLHRFDSFKELYATLPKEKLGYKENEIPAPESMNKYYSSEKQAEYGVLGIEIKLTDLQKFIDAQDYGYGFSETYETALSEMKKGVKTSHWIWYVFPQIHGLGISETTAYFSIKSLEEAIDYYNHPVLNSRLIEITSELLNIKTNDPMVVFGYIDAYKIRSCMTLFKRAVPDNDLFQRVLDKFYQGSDDYNTLKIIDSD